MKSSTLVMSFMATFVLLLLLAPASEATITCSDVIKDLQPCLKYLQSGSGLPPEPCCAGARSLASAATTTADKQAACACLKTTAQKANINAALAKALPGNCKISLPYTISPNMDCSKIT